MGVQCMDHHHVNILIDNHSPCYSASVARIDTDTSVEMFRELNQFYNLKNITLDKIYGCTLILLYWIMRRLQEMRADRKMGDRCKRYSKHVQELSNFQEDDDHAKY